MVDVGRLRRTFGLSLHFEVEERRLAKALHQDAEVALQRERQCAVLIAVLVITRDQHPHAAIEIQLA